MWFIDRGRWPSRVLLVLAVSAGCHQLLGPKPIDDNWRVHEGPRVDFYVRPGSFADQSADLPSDHAGRAYPETESFRFIAIPPLGDNLYGLMSHEANHVFVIDGLGRAGTYAMTEGLATALLSETFHAAGRHFLFPWTHRNRSQLPRLSRVFDNAEWKDIDEQTAYRTSASFLAWILDTYGAERLRAIYGAGSDEFAARVTTAYGSPLDKLESDWLAFCDAF